jgi:tryptophan synthase alpha chain
MNRLERLFASKQKNILNIYCTAGYPRLDSTLEVIHALEEGGADIVEIGMPFSDPLADGPTIQKSGQQALQNGMTVPLLLEQIRESRQSSTIPIILMGYFNQIMQFGEIPFFEQCAEAGVDGLILPDLPLEEYEHKYREILESLDLRISFLISPLTKAERIQRIAELSSAFVYMVSSTATTGGKHHFSSDTLSYFKRIEAMDLPSKRLIGFGISDHKAFSDACRYAHGAIIGSAYIRALEENQSISETTRTFIHTITADQNHLLL